MILFNATNQGDIVFLEDVDTGYWLRLWDPSFADYVEKGVRENFPHPYRCQLAEFNPIWIGEASVILINCDSNRVKVQLSDNRSFSAGGTDKNCGQIKSWLQNEVGIWEIEHF